MLRHLSSNPCVDCGEADVRVLEFDHVGTKESSVSALLSRGVSLARFEREINRCEVVCVNCHRRRTATRGGWLRLGGDRARHARVSPRCLRNISWVYASLSESSCIDCGLADPLLLEHDHVGAKQAGVMTLAWNEASIERIEREIAACEVRCCNCHRRRTAITRGWLRADAVNLADAPL
jgi:hypothetical protein